MRVGSFRRWAGRTAAAAVLGVGLSILGGAAAKADYNWDIAPPNGGSQNIEDPAPAQPERATQDYNWDY